MRRIRGETNERKRANYGYLTIFELNVVPITAVADC